VLIIAYILLDSQELLVYSTENMGYTKVENKFIERIACVTLPAHATRVLWVIVRRTWGFHRPTVELSYSEISHWTGLVKQYVSKAVIFLETANILHCKRPVNNRHKIAFTINENYDTWGVEIERTPEMEMVEFGLFG